jgi:hypothetical protein
MTAALTALDGVETRRWLPVTTIELPTGRLIGLSASTTLADARADGRMLEVALSPGRYEVRRAAPGDDDGEEDELLPLVWLRRLPEANQQPVAAP